MQSLDGGVKMKKNREGINAKLTENQNVFKYILLCKF